MVECGGYVVKYINYLHAGGIQVVPPNIEGATGNAFHSDTVALCTHMPIMPRTMYESCTLTLQNV